MKYLPQLFCLGLTTMIASTSFAQNTTAAKPAIDKSAVNAPQSKMNEFIRGVYWPWERTAWPAENAKMDTWQFAEKVMADLKNRYHVDLAWVVNIGAADAVRLSEIAGKYGISIIPVTGAIYDWRDVRTQKAAQQIAEKTVATLGGAKGIAGYVLIDEPKRSDVDQLETARAALAELDPARPALAVSMLRQTEAVARRTKLPFLVSDPYSYFGPNSPNGPNTPAQSRAYYLIATRQTVAFARQTGKTPWMMPQIFNDVWGDWHYDAKMNVVAEPGSSLHWRMPTVGETRWQIWQAIGAGAKGTVFYVLFPTPNPRRSGQDAKDMKGYRPMKPGVGMPLFETERPLNEATAILRNEGSSTPQGEAMGEVFAAIEPHRALLGRLEPATPIAFADAPVRASTFRDPVTGRTIIIAVNDNTDAAVTAKVRLLPSVKSVRDLIGNTDIAATDDSGLSALSVPIGAGEGKLLQIDGETGVAPTYVEDFSIQIGAGKLENVRKVLQPIEWGMGYQVVARTGTPVATASDPVAAPATGDKRGRLSYDLLSVAGDWKRMGGRLYLIYSGSGRATGENIEVETSTDGTNFQRLSVDQFNQPIAIPQGCTKLRFTLLNDEAMLKEWQMVTVP